MPKESIDLVGLYARLCHMEGDAVWLYGDDIPREVADKIAEAEAEFKKEAGRFRAEIKEDI